MTNINRMPVVKWLRAHKLPWLAPLSIALTWALLAQPTVAADPVDLMWEDLQPQMLSLQEQFNAADPEDPLGTPPQMTPSWDVVPELNGKRVRIPAYVVPLDGDNVSLSEMLLVPYFGACIHVPPPPPNQIIYINSDKAVDVSQLDLYMPVWATGVLKTELQQTELAEVGYLMEIEKLTVYDPRAANEQRKQSTIKR